MIFYTGKMDDDSEPPSPNNSFADVPENNTHIQEPKNPINNKNTKNHSHH